MAYEAGATTLRPYANLLGVDVEELRQALEGARGQAPYGRAPVPRQHRLVQLRGSDRLDLLKSVLGGRGRWTEAVAYEASRSAAKLPPLLPLPSEGWLDEPIEITDPADVRKIARIRRAGLRRHGR